MRIVHCSDWHGKTVRLPKADLYVITGDMLPNFRRHVIELPGGHTVEWQPDMKLVGGAPEKKPRGNLITLKLDPAHEAKMQARYLSHKGTGYLRDLMGSPNAPVVVCRGNHDFTSLVPMVLGGPVFDICHDPDRTHSVCGLRIGGFRGMTKHRGRWSDEFSEAEFKRRVAALPSDLDVLVTHNPPCGILDRIPDKDKYNPQWISIGSTSLLTYHLSRPGTLKAHLFGHIHESYGMKTMRNTVYSNAATGYNVIDL